MKESLIIAGLIYLFIENFSIEIQTKDDNVNNILNLPKQIPLHDIVFRTSKNTDDLIQIFLALNDKSKYLNK